MSARRRIRTSRRRLIRAWRSFGTHTLATVVGALALVAALWLADLLHRPHPAGWLDPLKTPAQQYAWTAQPAPAFPMPPYARFLAGVKIVLDPGHGGHAERRGWKAGPTGLREAEVNLHVAQFLREFLEAAGAEVHMTRTEDVCLDPNDAEDLALRIAIANNLPADLFLSIHHNGSDEADVNYTSLYYHAATPWTAASRCAGRHLATGLNDALRLERELSCPLVNDQVLFKSGLKVLRDARVPAVLGEGSFHSNPEEEQRLRDPVYNRREAYGYFLGLARWAQAGLPRVQLLQPETGVCRRGESLTIALDDGLSARGGWGNVGGQIAPDSIAVKLNGALIPFQPDLKKRQVRVRLPRDAKDGVVELLVDFENVLGQHVLQPGIELRMSNSE